MSSRYYVSTEGVYANRQRADSFRLTLVKSAAANGPVRSLGFTLLELMATLAIVAIIAGLATPGLQSLMQRSSIDSKRNALVEGIQLARSEAIFRGMPVQLCASSNGEDCGGTLEDGWIVQQISSNGDEPILIEANQRDAGRLEFNGSFTGVTFAPTGIAVPNLGGNTELAICAADADFAGKGFSLSVSGSVQLQTVDC